MGDTLHAIRNRNTVIIHICGPHGSGQSFMAKKLKEKKFINKYVIVKELDDLKREFINAKKPNLNNPNQLDILFQNYIDDYIDNVTRPVIFIGLNNKKSSSYSSNDYYNLHSKCNYFIDIDDRTLLKQKCFKMLTDVTDDKKMTNDLMNNNSVFIKKMNKQVEDFCKMSGTIQDTSKLKLYYKSKGYQFKERNEIVKSISAIFKHNKGSEKKKCTYFGETSRLRPLDKKKGTQKTARVTRKTAKKEYLRGKSQGITLRKTVKSSPNIPVNPIGVPLVPVNPIGVPLVPVGPMGTLVDPVVLAAAQQVAAQPNSVPLYIPPQLRNKSNLVPGVGIDAPSWR
jgi:hypothetical protein